MRNDRLHEQGVSRDVFIPTELAADIQGLAAVLHTPGQHSGPVAFNIPGILKEGVVYPMLLGFKSEYERYPFEVTIELDDASNASIVSIQASADNAGQRLLVGPFIFKPDFHESSELDTLATGEGYSAIDARVGSDGSFMMSGETPAHVQELLPMTEVRAEMYADVVAQAMHKKLGV